MRNVKTIVALGLAGAAAACGGGNKSNPDAGADASTGIDARPGSSFDNATDITGSIDVGTGTMATLVDTKTKNYYKLTLAAGDRLFIGTSTNAATVTDGSVTDTVVTLYDANKTPLAQDDDGWPRNSTDSQLLTEAGAAGTYYITVEDCNSHSTSGCYPATGVTDLGYTLHVFHLNKLTSPEINAAAAQDGTIAHAQTIPYAVPSGGTAGNYGIYNIDGNFGTLGATHVYAFTPPAATVLAGSRMRVEFFVQPISATNGDGSTSNIKAWVTPSNGTTILAMADQSNYKDGDSADGPLDLSVPVTKGAQYYLFVQSAATASAPATDYYFIQHFVGQYWYGTAELEGAAAMGINDTAQTAQPLTTPTGLTAGSFFADGNLSQTADVDWYEVDPPGGTKTASIDCGTYRRGSGVVGQTATLYAADGSTMIGTTGAETATADLSNSSITIPANTTKAYLKISAKSVGSTANTGTYYTCSVFYSAM
jgi:hypothetical protein